MFKSAWLLSGISAFGLLAGTAMAQDAKPMPSPAPAPAMSSPVVIGGCNSSCCTSGCTTGCFDNSCGCENSCGQGHILADVEFMILSPFWNNNLAMVVRNDPGGEDPVTDVKDFGQPDQFVPVIHLGYVNADGFGGRVGWWGFATSKTETLTGSGDQGSDGGIFSASPLGLEAAKPGNISGNFTAAYRLSMDVWDLEAVKTFESGNFSGLISGGFRYAHIGMDYDAAESFGEDGSRNGTPHHFLISGNDFNGAGLTSALEGRWGRTLYLAGTLRGSLLFGAGSQHATTGSTFFPTEIPIDDSQSNYNEVVPVLEAQLGIGIKGNQNRAIVPFFEVGVDMQAWFNAGNPSRSSVSVNSNNTDPNFGTGFAGSSSPDSTLGLFGIYIRGGLTY